MNLLQVESFSAMSPKELKAEINGFIAETKAEVKQIHFFNALDGCYGAFVTYYID